MAFIDEDQERLILEKLNVINSFFPDLRQIYLDLTPRRDTLCDR
jgi:hypothetical protein